MPPTRWMRYCCSELKEGGAKGRWIATGVRWAESVKRKSRGALEVLHSNKSKRLTLMNDNANCFLICDISDMEIAPEDFCSYGERMEE